MEEQKENCMGDLALLRQATLFLKGAGLPDVQIFASRVSDAGQTIDCNDGCGNWNARKEMVRMWVMKGDALEIKAAVDRTGPALED